MGKFVRYGLAAVCFASSAGCLALWGWTDASENTCIIVCYFANGKNADHQSPMFAVEMMQGEAVFRRYDEAFVDRGWDVKLATVSPTTTASFRDRVSKLGLFFVAEPWIYFPLWYPALVFAIAGVGVLRFRPQFSIRSALIVTTIVAALIGMTMVL